MSGIGQLFSSLYNSSLHSSGSSRGTLGLCKNADFSKSLLPLPSCCSTAFQQGDDVNLSLHLFPDPPPHCHLITSAFVSALLPAFFSLLFLPSLLFCLPLFRASLSAFIYFILYFSTFCSVFILFSFASSVLRSLFLPSSLLPFLLSFILFSLLCCSSFLLFRLHFVFFFPSLLFFVLPAFLPPSLPLFYSVFLSFAFPPFLSSLLFFSLPIFCSVFLYFVPLLFSVLYPFFLPPFCPTFLSSITLHSLPPAYAYSRKLTQDMCPLSHLPVQQSPPPAQLPVGFLCQESTRKGSIHSCARAR